MAKVTLLLLLRSCFWPSLQEMDRNHLFEMSTMRLLKDQCLPP